MKNVVFLAFCFCALAVEAQSRLFPIEIKGKWGYMNAEGKMKIPAQFDYADDFSEGYAVVALNRQPCLIDESGVRTIDTSLYQFIGMVSQGLSAVSGYEGKKYYVAPDGKKTIALPADIYEARAFKNGVAVLSRQTNDVVQKFGRDISTLGYRFALMDKNGKMITEFVYEDMEDMDGEVSRVRIGTKFGLMNQKGEIVAEPKFSNIGMFAEGKAVADLKGKYGYINTKGEWIIKPQFDFAYPFNEGMAGVMRKGKFGFVDQAGEVHIPLDFQAVKPFGEGKSAVMKDNKWGFIDKTGKWVIRNVFDDAGLFSEGLCPILYKRKWGFINEAGKVVIPAEYDAAGSFRDGVADVMMREVNFYINRRGEVLPVLK